MTRFSRYGVCNPLADFPRYYPAVRIVSLHDSGEGFTVISRYGLAGCLPDKEFRLSSYPASCRRAVSRTTLHVAMQMGPSLHPGTRMSDVWPLRILLAESFLLIVPTEQIITAC